MNTTWKCIVVTILFTMALLTPESSAQNETSPVIVPDRNIRFRHLTIGDGLSQNGVRVIFQDSQGFMWLGTWDGLNRYDGYQFIVYRNDPGDPNSLSDNMIGAIYEDPDGIFWIGTGAGGLNRFDPMTDTFTRYSHGEDSPQSLRGNFILDIAQDQQGFLWVATFDGGLSKFDPTTETFTHYRHDPEDLQTIGSDSVFAIVIDPSGMLWLATLGGGLTKLDPATGLCTRYQHDPQNPNSLQNNQVRALQLDQKGVLWVAVKGADIHAVNPETGEVIAFYPLNQTEAPHAFCLSADSQGTIWAGTYGSGLYALDPETGHVSHYQNEPGNPDSLNDKSVWALYEDRSGSIWAGTQDGGLNLFPAKTPDFRHYTHQPENPKSLDDKQVRSLYEDFSGILWVGTAKGLNKFNPLLQQFTHYEHHPEDEHSLGDGFNFAAIHQDRQGVLWVGGWRTGLNRLDPETDRFEHYYYDPQNLNSGHHTILDIHEDSSGMLWLATDLGLHRFDPQTQQFQAYQYAPDEPNSISKNHVRKIYEDRSGVLWLASWYSGLSAFAPGTGQFQRYRSEGNNPNSLASDAVYGILEDRQGHLWLGTSRGLDKFEKDSASFTHYSTKHGLSNDVICCLVEDEEGNLWISTNNGLSKFDPQTQIFTNYDVTHGLQSNQFAEGACYKSNDGELFFGGINGFNAFSPDQLSKNLYQPPVVLTNFRLFNKSVPIGKDSLLQQPIWATEKLILSHKDEIISFDFAALNYQSPAKNQYQYMLEAFENSWNSVDSSRRSATYTNLPAGNYVFRVKGSNNDGVWSQREVALEIAVAPPWWKTWWFQNALLALIVSLVAGSYLWRTYIIQQQNRQLEQEVTKRTAELQTSESHYRELFDTMTSGVAVYEAIEEGEDFIFREFNRAGERIENVKREDLLGRRVTEMFPGVKAFGVFKVFQRIWRKGGIEYIPPALYQDDQRASWRENWVYKLPSDEIVSVYNDVTERIEAEHALHGAKEEAESARKKAEDANRAKSIFLANMSHELRTPLNAILGFTQIMARDPNSSEERENLGLIHRSGEHLLTLINQVLDLSKIEAGRITLNEENFDLYHLLDDLKDMFSLTVQHKGLQLRFDRSEDIPQSVRTDAIKLRQVLLNLLSNATKFTEEGEVQLSVSSNQLSVSNNQLSASNNQVKTDSCSLIFEVRDTGLGIAAEEMDKLFEAFAQTETGRLAQEGTGLGLPISRKFVQLMGGDIEVRSEVGEGTTFTFDIQVGIIDAAEIEEARFTRHAIALAPDQPDYRMLIVDDKPDNRTLLVKLLNPFGFELREAENGREAIDMWQAWRPHLIWMDLRMPVMDGYGATQQIRATPKGEEVKIILLSASSIEDERRIALSKGCDDFLLKPFHEEKIFELMHKHLGLRFVYEKARTLRIRSGQASDKGQKEDENLRPDALRALPPEILTRLEHAATIADIRQLETITADVHSYDAALAEGLIRLAKNFDYVKILNAIQDAGK